MRSKLYLVYPGGHTMFDMPDCIACSAEFNPYPANVENMVSS